MLLFLLCFLTVLSEVDYGYGVFVQNGVHPAKKNIKNMAFLIPADETLFVPKNILYQRQIESKRGFLNRDLLFAKCEQDIKLGHQFQTKGRIKDIVDECRKYKTEVYNNYDRNASLKVLTFGSRCCALLERYLKNWKERKMRHSPFHHRGTNYRNRMKYLVADDNIWLQTNDRGTPIRSKRTAEQQDISSSLVHKHELSGREYSKATATSGLTGPTRISYMYYDATGNFKIDTLEKAYELLYTILWRATMNDTAGNNFPNLTIDAEEQCINTLNYYYRSKNGQLKGKFSDPY